MKTKKEKELLVEIENLRGEEKRLGKRVLELQERNQQLVRSCGDPFLELRKLSHELEEANRRLKAYEEPLPDEHSQTQYYINRGDYETAYNILSYRMAHEKTRRVCMEETIEKLEKETRNGFIENDIHLTTIKNLEGIIAELKEECELFGKDLLVKQADEIRELTHRLRIQTQSCETINADRCEIRAELHSVQEDLERKNKTIDDLCEEIRELKSKLKPLQELIAAHEHYGWQGIGGRYQYGRLPKEEVSLQKEFAKRDLRFGEVETIQDCFQDELALLRKNISEVAFMAGMSHGEISSRLSELGSKVSKIAKQLDKQNEK